MYLHTFVWLTFFAAVGVCFIWDRESTRRFWLASTLGMTGALLLLLFWFGLGVGDTWVFYPFRLPWLKWLLPASLLSAAVWQAWRCRLTGRVVGLASRAGVSNGSASTATTSETENRFRELTQQWREATALTSSTTDMVMHPAYQQIVGMGRDALPLIFAELRHTPDHWFWALKAITGEDPVAPADRGKVGRMAEAWLAWAQARGY